MDVIRKCADWISELALQMKTRAVKNKRTLRILYDCTLPVALVILGVFLWRNVRFGLNSDDSSELVLSHLLAQEGGILSPNWYYSELRLLQMQLIFSFLFRFTNNWLAVRVFGTLIGLVIMEGGVYCLFRELNCRKYFPLAGMLLLAPLSPFYRYVIVTTPHYVPCVSISFYSLAMTFHYARSQNIQRKILLFGIAALSFLAGLGGERQVFVSYIPLALSVGICAFLLNANASTQGDAAITAAAFLKNYAPPACVSLGCSVLGYLINSRILHNYYSFREYNRISLIDFSFENLASMFRLILGGYGYITGSILSFNVALRFAVAVSLFILTFAIACKSGAKIKTRASEEQVKRSLTSLFFLVIMAVFALLWSFTNSPLVDRYLVPGLIFSIPVIMINSDFDRKSPMVRGAFILLFSGIIVIGCQNMNDFLRSASTKDQSEVAAFLQEQDCVSGYASYWNANILTELSNGAIEVWSWIGNISISNDSDANIPLYKWLQLKRHNDTHPEGKVFLLFRKAELDNLTWKSMLPNPSFVIGNYNVYCFSDYDELRRTFRNFVFTQSDLSQWRYIRNGKATDSGVVISSGGICFGPYVTLQSGSYQVFIDGANLDKASFDCVYDSSAVSVPMENFTNSGNSVSYVFSLADAANNVETRIRNPSGSEVSVTVTGIRIEKIT